MTQIEHPSGINPSVVAKVVRRRGRLHAFPHLEPARTALVVVDLDVGTVTRVGDEITAFVPQINIMAQALRAAGGTVAWVTSPIRTASPRFRALYGDDMAAMYEAEGADGVAQRIWPGLSVEPGDVHATKKGASAFFPGNCDLHQRLQVRDIQSLLIVGAVTNVCCESSARDACELEYEVTLVSDCLWGHKDGQHEATLATFYRNYGDVRPSAGVVELIAASAAGSSGPEAQPAAGSVRCLWRGAFSDGELNALHAEAFDHPLEDHRWGDQLSRWSLGWVIARDDDGLVGFVNVIGDGRSHAVVLDTMVALRARRQGIGERLIATAAEHAREAGYAWLHVDFQARHRAFYLEACGFTPTAAGLIALT